MNLQSTAPSGGPLAVKVTLEMVSGKYSWTEAHYYLANSSATQVAFQPALNLAQARGGCLGTGAQIERVRLSSYPANRLTQDLDGQYIQGIPQWPAGPAQGPGYQAGIAGECILGRLQSVLGNGRNYFLAGIPAVSVRQMQTNQDGIDWSQPAGFSTRLQTLASVLCTGQWGWLTTTTSVFQPCQAPITSVAFPGMVGLVVKNPIGTLTDPQNIPPNTQLQATGWSRICVKQPRLNGRWFLGGILPPPAGGSGWTYFLYGSGSVPLGNYKKNGSLGQIVLSFSTYTTLTFMSATTRKRGATSTRPRGRSSLRR